jgi:hypothetical protein
MNPAGREQGSCTALQPVSPGRLKIPEKDSKDQGVRQSRSWHRANSQNSNRSMGGYPKTAFARGY